MGGLCETRRVTYKVDGLDEISEEMARLFSYHETFYDYAKIYKKGFNIIIVYFFICKKIIYKSINIERKKLLSKLFPGKQEKYNLILSKHIINSDYRLWPSEEQ